MVRAQRPGVRLRKLGTFSYYRQWSYVGLIIKLLFCLLCQPLSAQRLLQLLGFLCLTSSQRNVFSCQGEWTTRMILHCRSSLSVFKSVWFFKLKISNVFISVGTKKAPWNEKLKANLNYQRTLKNRLLQESVTHIFLFRFRRCLCTVALPFKQGTVKLEPWNYIFSINHHHLKSSPFV